MVRGTLTGYRWLPDADRSALLPRRLLAGRHAGLPRRLRARRGEPGAGAGSVGARVYSPPLTAMSYYDVVEDGRTLRYIRSLLTDDPEPQLDDRGAQVPA